MFYWYTFYTGLGAECVFFTQGEFLWSLPKYYYTDICRKCVKNTKVLVLPVLGSSSTILVNWAVESVSPFTFKPLCTAAKTLPDGEIVKPSNPRLGCLYFNISGNPVPGWYLCNSFPFLSNFIIKNS